MDQALTEYIQATQKVLSQVKALLSVQHDMRQGLLNHDFKAIDSILQKQQAMGMKLDSLEKKRYEAQSAAGFDGRSSSEILQAVQDVDTKHILSGLFEQLRQSIESLQHTNHLSMEIAEMELQLAGKTERSRNTVYRSGGTIGSDAADGKAFEEKI